MQVRIYRPAKTAMQSGRNKIPGWVIEFEPEAPSIPDTLMGWSSSSDTRQQVNLRFDSEEEAIAFAHRHGYTYNVEKPKERRIKLKNYADNFANTRRDPWTH
jgi:imidazoleglycerol phosphate synthase glutamine amidotransferase subunit HisH